MGGLEQSSAAAGLAWLALIGVVYLVVFLGDRRRTAPGWLALLAWSGLVYPLWVLGLLGPLLGPLHHEVLAASLVLGAVTGLHLTCARYQLPRPRWLWAALLAPLAALLPDPIARVACIGAGAFALTAQVHLLVGLMRHRPRPRNARSLLVAWLALAAGAVIDLFGLAPGARAFGFALTGFALLQTFAMARDHLASLREGEVLQRELAAQLAEVRASHHQIDLLNVELRRQIGLRSRQLVEALSRLSVASAERGALAAGAQVGGRYRVLRRLGSGAMGSVYEVRRLSDQRRFALKALHEQADRVGLARFAREAQILAELSHPNLVAIVDIDVASRGLMFLIMDLVDGVCLEERADRYGEQGWALSIAGQIAAGLAAIHAHGVVHRDLKPANILLEASGEGGDRVRIADFGIAGLSATALSDTQPGALARGPLERLTATGLVMGTPLYMAPELAEGARAVGPAADVYSLGLIAFELLTGKPAFDEPPLAQLLCGRVPRARGSLVELCPSLPPALAALIDGCLAPDPAARPSAEAVATACREAAQARDAA